MKKFTFLTILFIGLYFLSGCSKDDDSNDNGSFDCLFLEVGNKWTYDYSEFFGSDTLIIEIVSESNGVYEVFQRAGNNSKTEYWYTDGAFLKVYSQGEQKSGARRIFKCGAAVGDTWTEDSQSTPGGTITYEVIGLGNSIATQDRVYNDCVKIELNFSYASNTQYNYWSPDFGQVYQDGFVSLDLIEKNF